MPKRLKSVPENYLKRLKTIQETDVLKEQYYTSRDVADRLVSRMIEIIDRFNVDVYVDSSAGDGYVAKLLQSKKSCLKETILFDLEPHPTDNSISINHQDWLDLKHLPVRNTKSVMIGFNPPFGYRGDTAKKIHDARI